MAYIKRAAEDTIARVSKMFPVLLVTGPRQVEKTTLLQRMAEVQQSEGIERKYVTLDDPDARYLAKTDPALFLQRYSPPVLIDEIQYATELLPYIKMSVDHSKKKGETFKTVHVILSNDLTKSPFCPSGVCTSFKRYLKIVRVGYIYIA